MNKLVANALIAVSLTAAAIAPAGAQTTTPSAPGSGQASQGMRMHPAMAGRDDRRPFSRPTERVEARIAYIKTALKITDAQQPLWDSFANLMRKQASEREKRMGEWRAHMAPNSAPREHRRPTAIERMEREQQMLATASRMLNERLDVEKPLYAALTSEQKRVADEILASHGHRGGFGQRMRHGNQGWGG